MDRREMLKGAGGAFAAASLGMSGLSESVSWPDGRGSVDYDACKPLIKNRAEAERWMTSVPPPYDPVAVLEAMASVDGNGHWLYAFSVVLEIAHGSYPMRWDARFYPGDDANGWPLPANEKRFPDFPSAVRWLHEQAAAVDAEFASRWPVPAEVKQDG